MSPFGNPKLLCEECEADIETVTADRDYDKIVSAIERLGLRVSDSQTIDAQSYEAVKNILETAGDRATAIKNGTYDFSLDEAAEEEEEGYDDIPEDMKETEEDAELDRKDEENMKKFDKVFTWVAIAAFAAVGVFIVYRLLDMWVF